jgi:hypothetical protein
LDSSGADMNCERGNKLSVSLKCGESDLERNSFSRSSRHALSIIIVAIIVFIVWCFVKNEQCIASLLILNADKPNLV